MIPLVSISLLAYNGKKYLKDCLNSVCSQSYKEIELIVIDNDSSDGTKEIVKKISFGGPLIKVFNQKNLGFSAGHNQAIKKAKGKYILCLNQDVFLDKYFIQKAVETMEKDDKIASVQGKLLRWTNDLPVFRGYTDYHISHIIDTTGLEMLKNRRIINRRQGEIDSQEQEEAIEEIFGADGAAPLYRREALESIKISLKETEQEEYFDEDFFCYKEDVDLAWRLRLYGWKSIYQPAALGWHARTAGESASRKYFSIIRERLKINPFGKYHAFRNQRLMQVKNEQIGLLARHFPRLAVKEMGSWFFVLVFEKYTWRAIKEFFQLLPQALQKRKIIMAKKIASTEEMKQWFK